MSSVQHANERIASALEDISAVMGGTIPEIEEGDDGKVLTADNGEYTLAAIPSQLPAVTSADEGKVLTVDANGKWVAADLPAE